MYEIVINESAGVVAFISGGRTAFTYGIAYLLDNEIAGAMQCLINKGCGVNHFKACLEARTKLLESTA